MLKKISICLFVIVCLFVVDQYIKSIFVNGFVKHWKCISLVLAYNKGVAFSMFSFLWEYLKYIQIVILLSGIVYLVSNKNIFETYYLPIAFLISGGISNIYDRFHYTGVVDYIYWHCWFDFAIFNLADVLIDVSVVWIVILNFVKSKNP
jgi:signal peptidase II